MDMSVLPGGGWTGTVALIHRRDRVPPGNIFRLKLSPTRPILSYVEDIMTDRQDDSRRDNRGVEVRSITSRTPRQRLTPERTAEIRLRILERAYDSPQIADTIARRLLQQGDI
jgi:hypothetical protein